MDCSRRLALRLMVMLLCVQSVAICLADDGFKPIFDCKSLEGWKGPEMSFWSIEDGAITGTITASHAPTMNQYLVHQAEKLADFELKLDYRHIGSTTPDT